MKTQIKIKKDKNVKNTKIEKEILNLYKNQFQNDYKKQKDETESHLTNLKTQLSIDNRELASLKSTNRELKMNIKRYKEFIESFDEESYLTFVENKAAKKPEKKKRLSVVSKYPTKDFSSSQF